MTRTLIALLSLSTAATPLPPPQPDLVIVKEGTGLYHRATCPVIRDGEGVLALGRPQAEARGFKAHDDCDPAKASSNPAKPLSVPERRPKAPAVVFTDSSKYYHRESCAKLGTPHRKVLLEDAGRQQWPCPACKPPVRTKSDLPAIPKRLRRG